MMIVDIHVALSLATSRGQVRLVTWREGRELYDVVHARGAGDGPCFPIRPDAFFTLENVNRVEDTKRINFFLEADRSTSTQGRFADKLRAYWHYRNQGLHERKFGIKTFRVLTVALTETRAENLCRMASSVLLEGARKHYLFTSAKRFSLSDPKAALAEVCLSPRDFAAGRLHSLLPKVSSVAEGKEIGKMASGELLGSSVPAISSEIHFAEEGRHIDRGSQEPQR